MARVWVWCLLALLAASAAVAMDSDQEVFDHLDFADLSLGASDGLLEEGGGRAELLEGGEAPTKHRVKVVPTGPTSHSAIHRAAVEHAMHKKSQQLSNGKPITLPTIPKSPPVCSTPPPMRFCKDVKYPVYRPSAAHTFAQLDFDSHAVFKKIVPHMRISERHFELPDIQTCRNNFRTFLCLRNFPRCCHVGLCNKYGDPEPALTTEDLIPPAALKRQKATTVTFVNGSKDIMKVQKGRNDTVKVKVADAVCLQYVNTYTPLFDCRAECARLLSKDCLFMLSQDCDNLCYGVHSEKCATKQLFGIATGKDTGAGSAARPSTLLAAMLALACAVLGAAAGGR